MKAFSARLFLAAFAALSPFGAFAQRADFNVIPLPREVKAVEAADFELSGKTRIEYPATDLKMRRNAEFLRDYIKELTGFNLALAPSAGGSAAGCIRFQLGLNAQSEEAYKLRCDGTSIVIDAASPAGAFYAVQTLRKAIPSVKSGKTNGSAAPATLKIPAVEINDAPRFSYRGAHFDTSRHFFSTDSVCRFIDMLALHNINRFHWHITDDQGWRIEIKKYPRLTEVGSKRKETVIGHNTGRYDGKPYGGFYTQEDVKRIIEYARERHITIIPEIDLPGHMLGALAAYPELGCTGGLYDVWTMWGVSDDVLCAGNDKVLTFIDDVLDEIVDLFPSEYIHVGGDECPKTRWKTCPKCQERIKAEGLEADGKHTAEERLQSYVIRHAEKHLAERGRKMIGWDETLEGGLAPGATVMSWRGEGGGIQAAKMGHDVIMTPNTYLYFDYYQTKDRTNEPEAIGGYLPLERVYGYEPMPASLSPKEQKYIIGVQANCWTEYMPTFRQVEYMELPRMAALAEVQWTQQGTKNYQKFLQRLPQMLAHYDVEGYNYATHVYDLMPTVTTQPEKGGIEVSFATIDNAPISYTLDGTEPTAKSKRYTKPVLVKKNQTLKAAAIRGEKKSRVFTEAFAFNKATAHKATLTYKPAGNYAFGGAAALVDGLRGADTNYKSGRWVGFYRQPLELLIDLGKAQKLSELSFNSCVEKGDWIMDARSIEVLAGDDPASLKRAAFEEYPALTSDYANGIHRHTLKLAGAKGRYVKLIAKPEMALPAWHPGKGNPAFLFVDEVEVK